MSDTPPSVSSQPRTKLIGVENTYLSALTKIRTAESPATITSNVFVRLCCDVREKDSTTFARDGISGIVRPKKTPKLEPHLRATRTRKEIRKSPERKRRARRLNLQKLIYQYRTASLDTVRSDNNYCHANTTHQIARVQHKHTRRHFLEAGARRSPKLLCNKEKY